MGAGLKNQPSGSSVTWYIVDVFRHNDVYTVQVAYLFTSSTYPVYIRTQTNGTWNAWWLFNPGTANTAQVLSGYTFSSANGVNLSGTMANRGNLNWSPSGSSSYSVPAGYYSGGTLNSSSAYNSGYNNGVNAGKNSVSGGGVSKSYSATANNVRNNAPNYKLTGISGTGYIIGFIWIKRVWGDMPSRTFTVTNGSPSTVVNYVWDNYQNRNSASEMGMWFVKVRITNASNASAYFTIGHEYNPEFLVSIHFFRQ